MIPAAKMSSGQLKLHYGALCSYHGCDGVNALSRASVADNNLLRECLIAYEAAAAIKDWLAAEDALLRVVA